jgi:hypothetical protein
LYLIAPFISKVVMNYKRDDRVKYKDSWLATIPHANALRSKWGTVDFVDRYSVMVYWGGQERTRCTDDQIEAV